MKKQKLSFQKLFENDTFIKVFSLLVAIFAWFAVMISQKTDMNATIDNVPVKISYEGSVPQGLGLQRIGDAEITVTVYVTGKTSKVQRLTADDFNATIALNNVNQAQTYTLPIEVTKKNNDPDYQITGWSELMVPLSFDKIVTKQFPVQVSTPKLSAADGYIMHAPYVDEENIVVSGPQNTIRKIDRCVITLNQEEELTDFLTVTGVPILLDVNGATVDSEYLTVEPGSLEVTVPVYKTKRMDLRLEFVNIPRGFPIERLNYTLSQNGVAVAAAADIIDNQDEIVIGPVDFRTVDIGKEISLDVTLPAGFTNVENVTNVTVTFPTYGLASKTLSVPETNFVLENIPTGFNAQVVSRGLDNVKLVGDSAVINSLSPDDLVASVDLSQVTAKRGQYTVTVKVYCQNKALAWAVGEYAVNVSLTERE